MRDDQSSVYSMSQASSFRARPRVGQNLDDEDSENGDAGLLEKQSALEKGVFGALFTLTKGDSERRTHSQWMLICVLLDAWQLAITVVRPAWGWDIDPHSSAWLIAASPAFAWLGELGYGLYMALLYCMIAVLGIDIALCGWVAWSFKEQKLDYVWPIKVLRLLSMVFFQAFDVASLNLLQVGISCMYTGPEQPHMHVEAFPSYECFSGTHLPQAIASGLALAVFIVIALLLNMAEVEVNPITKRTRALAHSGAEVVAFTVKVCITLVGVFIGWPKVASVLYLLLALGLAWLYLRWAPHLVAWPNHLKSGAALAIVYASSLQVLLVFVPSLSSSGSSAMTVALAAGFAPVMAAGYGLSHLVLRYRTRSALKAFASVRPSVKLEDVYGFRDPRDVEVVARSCRVWSDLYTLDKEAVAMAETVLKAGVALFPKDPFMLLAYADFMIDVLGVSQSGQRQIEMAKRADPGIICRFMMFVRHQLATQRAASNIAGGAGGMDLLGFVEYQRKQRMVVRCHKEALMAMASFWRILDTSTVSFMALSKALRSIESSILQAEQAYRVVLETYSTSPKLVRLYAKFREGIKNDPWGAAEYYAEAERLEEAQQGDGQGPKLPDGTPLSHMEELSTAVLVVNAWGEVQMANKKAHALFGYKKGELDGKSVNILMPPHHAAAHTAQMRHFVEANTTARGAEGVGFTRNVTGLQRDRVAFPIKLSVSLSSGIGEDSIFIGLIEPLPLPRRTSALWVAAGGVVACCDPNFITTFGFQPDDIIGSKLQDLIRPSRALDRPEEGAAGGIGAAAGQYDAPQAEDGGELLARLCAQALNATAGAAAAAVAAGPAAARCLVAHKYVDAKPCAISVKLLGGGGATPVFEVKMTLESEEPQLLMVAGRKGTVKHISGDLAARLGIAAGTHKGAAAEEGDKAGGGAAAAGAGAALDPGPAAGAANLTLQEFLPPHWRDLHSKYFKELAGPPAAPGEALTGDPAAQQLLSPQGAGSPPGACAAAKPLFGPTLELRDARGRPTYMRVRASASQQGGEALQLLAMQPSSLQAALAERRVCMTLSPEGGVLSVDDGTPVQLFGFDVMQLVGRKLWDFASITSTAAASDAAVDGALLAGGAPHDDLAQELQAVVGSAAQAARARRVFDALVRRALRCPGESWRVGVVSPSALEEVAAMAGDDPDLAAALMARRTLPAILQVDVSVSLAAAQPQPSATTPSAAAPASLDEVAPRPKPKPTLKIHAQLWSASELSCIAQLDARGRILAVHEQALRPLGLLFGRPTAELVAAPLGELVALGGRSVAGLLSDGPKSSLKSKPKDKDKNKVGPVQLLAAFHADGRPLEIALQLVGAPGPGQPLTALIKLHRPAAGAPQDSNLELPDLPAAAGSPVRHGSPGALLRPARSGSLRAAPSLALRDAGEAKGALGAAAARGRTISSPRGPRRAATNTAAAAPPMPAALAAGLSLAGMSSVVRARTAGNLAPGGTANGGEPQDQGRAPGTPPARGGAGQKVAEGDQKLDSLVDEELMAALPGVVTPRKGPALAASSPRASAHLGGGAGKARAGAKGGDEDGDSSGAEGSNDSSDDGDGDKDLARAVSGPQMDRIANWVSSKGEKFQNDGAPASNDDEGATPPANVKASLLRSSPLGPGAGTGRGAAGARPTAADDAMSDGGHSAASGMSGMSGMSGVSGAQSAAGADYKRGKRFRKLVKLMDSPQAQRVLLRFKNHALATVGVLIAIHIVCFVMMVLSIKGQEKSMDMLATKGQSLRYLHRLLVDTRTLDLIHKGRGLPHLYTREEADYYAKDILHYATSVKELNNEAVEQTQGTHHAFDIYYYQKIRVWVTWSPEGEDVYDDVALWDAATRVYSAAKGVYQHHAEWAAQGRNLSGTTDAAYILRSVPELFDSYREVLEAMMMSAVDSANQVNMLQLIFLVIEGCVACSIAAAYLVFLLRAVSRQRYMLYGTFLTIPLGLTRALVTQNMHLLDEDEDSDEDGEEAEGGAGAGDADKDAASGVSGPVTGGTHGKGPHAEKERRKVDIGAAVSEKEKAAEAGGGASVAGGRPPRSQRRSVLDLQGDIAAVLGAELQQQQRSAGIFGWFQGLLPRGWAGRNQVLPNNVGPWATHGSAPLPPKRVLKQDSRQTLFMLTPFFLWFVLIVSLYCVDYIKLQGVGELVAVQTVANYNSARTYRTVFYAQELASLEDASHLEAAKELLHLQWYKLREVFYTLQLGAEAYKLLGPDTERFQMVKRPLSYETQEMVELFYRNTGCLRLEEHLPCVGPGHRFHEATHVGVDTLMQQFLLQVKDMVQEVNDTQPGLANPRFDFIFNAGMKDLADGNQRIVMAHLNDITALFEDVLLLHVVLFVLVFVVFAGFVVLLLWPMLKRLKKEKRRIAELMSQLPLELDVATLVGAALVGAAANGNGSSPGAPGDKQDALTHTGTLNDASLPALAAGASEGGNAKAWKNVLRSASMGGSALAGGAPAGK